MSDLWFTKEQIEAEEKAGRFNSPWDERSFRSRILQDWLTMFESRKEICKALSDLYDACMHADAEGELYYTIDGDLLDAARQAIKQVEG